MTETPSTKDQAQQAAGAAVDEGRHVAGTAAEEARAVAGEAQTHVKGLLDEALTQVEQQTRTQRDRIAETLQSFAGDLDEMASHGNAGPATDLARQAGQRARALGEHLDGREPRQLVDDVRGFARQRPAMFLAGALVAGVVAGRLARGAKDARSGAADQTGTTGATGTTATVGATGAATGDRLPPVATATTGLPSTTQVTGTSVPPATPAYPATSTGSFDPESSTYAETVGGTVDRDEDPLGLDDPAVGAAVPPNPTGRYEP